MGYTYAHQKKPGDARPAYTHTQAASAGEQAPAIPNSARLAALQSGAIKPGTAELGRRVDLPEAVRAKMEASFGANLSAVRLYESEAVADAGAKAVTQGNNIAFAPGKLDFVSSGGRALLGHELSHVVTQQRGEVTGGGFLNDRALEARADREGAMAARGESVYGGAAAPLTTASAAPAAGPMQAMKDKESAELNELETMRDQNRPDGLNPLLGDAKPFGPKQEKRFQKLNTKAWKERQKSMTNGSFYDLLESSLASDPTNERGDIPKYAVKWYQKHKKKGSRKSGKKGWGTPDMFMPILPDA